MYGSVLEKVESFYFIGIYFGQRLSLRGYIRQVVNKCKKSGDHNDTLWGSNGELISCQLNI